MAEPIRIIVDKCVGCGLCVKVCAYDAVTLVDKKAVLNERCTICGACVSACKYDAIVIERRPFKGQDVENYSGICIFAEHRNGALSSVVYEIVGAARELKVSLEKKISAILLGENVRAMAEELVSYGVGEVWMMEDPAIGDFNEEIQADLVAKILLDKKPEIFLGGGTIIGRSLLPRVAAKILTGLTADCTELSIDGENKLLRQTRPAFGGNIMATILCNSHRPQMATVRHKVMKAAEALEGHEGRIQELSYPVLKPRVEVLEFVREEMDTVNLADADFIVSGGRGLKDPKNFALIEELARAIGGAVGASRAAVDAGWIPYSHQVGQTGKTVNPTIYVACGISGAIQHLAGMKGSDIIVAINNDPAAPIFNVAHYGIVGSLFDVVPEMVRQIKGS
ncbi:MAG: electron transfer flavoprotein subunit alpha [Spirochaetales bacterium]|nr:electron transfer flavoprotein subunit alpha [Spirochaetales bacterium]